MKFANRPPLVAAALAAFVAATGAHAAERIVVASLDDVNGKVLINQGKGFVGARPGMEVRAGDRVITLDGSAARIVYKDGCVTRLTERNLLPIEAKGCSTRTVNPDAEVTRLAQAIGGGTRTDVPPAPAPAPSVPVEAAGPAWATPVMVAGALLVVGAGGGGGGGGDSKPISP